MGFFDDVFGNAFDFNGDGHTDISEELLAFMLFEEIEKEDADDSDIFSDNDMLDDEF